MRMDNKSISGDSGFQVRRDYANYLSNDANCSPSIQYYPQQQNIMYSQYPVNSMIINPNPNMIDPRQYNQKHQIQNHIN